MPSTERLFLAVPLAAATRQAIEAHLRRALGPAGLPGRPASPDGWHLTLRFLGDTERRQRDVVTARMRAADLGAPFDVSLTSLGAFPSPSRARVLWLGTGDGADRLAALAAHAERAAVAAGFEPERRRYAAHLTLSRLRPEEDVREAIAAVPPLAVRETALEVVLFRSRLLPTGARYEEVERFPLAGGGA